jgi:hypothetical protein
MRRLSLVAALLLLLNTSQPGAAHPGIAGARSQAPSSGTAVSQEIIPLDKVLKSQAAVVSQRIANTDITVKYSRPVARGRQLFGSLVPYNEVWHPGANDATNLTTTRDVEIQGKPLAAGKYGIWAIPRPETWTIIFSRASEVWHQPYPGEAQDVLRVDSRSERGAHMEALTYYFPVVEGKDAVLRLHWGEVMVPLSIRVP